LLKTEALFQEASLMKTTRRHPRAFTLVELLVVIAIIGILAAILVPVVGVVNRRAKNARIVLELEQLVAAIDQYESKYGDRPPDFSNPVVVSRHLQKAFPRISAEERSVINSLWYTDTGDTGELMPLIDPAEAIVFLLGGLSSDPKRPFTGQGGPIILVRDASGNITGMLANPDRNSPLFEFEDTRLTQFQNANGVLLSNDEEVLHSLDPSLNDAFPTYLPPGLKTPYVYFDSRTYIHTPVNGTVGQNLPAPVPSPPMYPIKTHIPAFSSDGATKIDGIAVPYRSDNPRQATTYDSILFEWTNQKTYQLITAGLDNNYGAYNVKRYPSGVNYGLDLNNPQFEQGADYDNICNFSDGRTLEDCIP
jgi:prepilin-type N-terminal cleavage/methylation domain-containing protein